MHKLLERQVKRYFGKTVSIDSLDENLINLLKDISQTYSDTDGERKFLENTITVNTEELNTLLRERSSLLESKTLENQEVINLLHQYKNAIDRALIVSVTDLDGIIKYVNDNFCKISGYSKEELIGKSCSLLRDINNHSSLFENLWETIRDKKIWHGTFSNLKKNGESYYINMTIVPLLDTNHEIKEFISLSEDVTQEIVYQKELKSQEERISTIFNTQENIVVIVDENDGIVDANRRFYEVFNFKDLNDYKSSVKNISSLFKIDEENISEDLSESQWFRQFFQNNSYLHKLIRLDNNDSEQIFSIHCRSAILDDKLHYLCTFINITELENARKKAEIEQKAKSIFLANMSHEIRTPLNAIIGFSDILCESEISPKDKENAEIISRSAKSLVGIINDVLDISKMESGKLDIANEIFLFESFIEQIVELFSVAAKEKKIRFIYNPESILPYSLISDSTRLRQVLTNLLSNAIKFTPQKGEVVFSIKIVETFENSVKIKFLIKDSGIGMSQEQQKIIFDPFSQADDGISRKYGGTGLGLAISSDIIKLMNSQIELNSNLNEGSEFSFVLDFKVDKFGNQKVLDKNLKILLHCCDGNNEKLRENIKNHINKIGHISDYSIENKKGDILFCCGMSNLSSVVEEFKKQNKNSLIIYVGDSMNELDKKTKDNLDHQLELPIYGSKIYNILAEHSDIHTHVIKKSTNTKKLNGRVLVAEDNPNNQKLIEILLLKLGVKTVIASNGQEAVDCYKKDKYDLILMDINMPIMDGITATNLIRELEKDNYKIPIVALTANSIAGDKEKYLSQGMDEYLSKPIEFDKLVAILEKYLSYGANELELKKISIDDISKRFEIPLEITEQLISGFKNDIKKDLEQLNSFIANVDIDLIRQKAYYIKNSCLTVELQNAVEILEKIENLTKKEDLLIEFDKLNKIILFACMA